MADTKVIRWIFACALIAAFSVSAAQPLPPANPQQSTIANVPSMTTATYGDWVLRCSQPTGIHACEVAQTVYLQGQQTPFALIAIGREKPTEPLRLIAQLPVNVTTSAPVKITLVKGQPAVELHFERCVPAGCFAVMAPADQAIKRLRAQTGPSRINFTDASQRDVAFQFSLRGLGPALDALTKSQ